MPSQTTRTVGHPQAPNGQPEFLWSTLMSIRFRPNVLHYSYAEPLGIAVSDQIPLYLVVPHKNNATKCSASTRKTARRAFGSWPFCEAKIDKF